MFKSLSIIFVVFFLQGAISQKVYKGLCPVVNALSSWKIEPFMGVWFNYATYTDQASHLTTKICIYANYTNLGDNNVDIGGSGFNREGQVLVSYNWLGKVVSPGHITFAAIGSALSSIKVLDTDYEHWATVYDCRPLNDTNYIVDTFIVSRNFTMEEKYYEQAVKILQEVGVDRNGLVRSDQDNCPSSVLNNTIY